MKSIIFKILVFMLIVSTSVACSESWLEIEQKGVKSQDEFYQTDDECISAIAAVYDMLQGCYAVDWESLWHVKTVITDEVNACGSDVGDQPEYQLINLFENTPSNTKLYGIWKRLYFAAYRANVVIAKVDPNTPEKKKVVAEAKALRAYVYFELVNLFGEVPLVLAEQTPAEYYVEKSSVVDIYIQIEKDLKEAAVDLPLKKDIMGTSNAWRITKGFALALHGKALLFQEKYGEAATILGSVIASNQYGLVDDFDRVLRHENEYGEESLFELGYVTTEGHTWGNNTFQWGQDRKQENNIHWQLCGYRDLNGGTSDLLGGWGHNQPTQAIYDYFKTDDPRRDVSLMDTLDFRTLYPTSKTPDGWQNEGKIRFKYGTWKDETDMDATPELNYGTNFRVMRYAEVLLLAAEAYLKDSQEAKAVIEFNKVRERAGYDQVTSLTMEDIKYEKTAELSFEGFRYYDLVRWGDAAAKLGARGYEAKHAHFPIPQQELDSNPSLTQNDPWK